MADEAKPDKRDASETKRHGHYWVGKDGREWSTFTTDKDETIEVARGPRSSGVDPKK